MVDYVKFSTHKYCRPTLALVLVLYVMFFILMYTMMGDDYAQLDNPPRTAAQEKPTMMMDTEQVMMMPIVWLINKNI